MEAVRRAVPGDEERFLELAGALALALTGQRGGSLLLSHHSQSALDGAEGLRPFDELLRDPGTAVLMGTLEGVVTGAALGHVDVLDDGTRLGHLDGCYVEPGARGVGLGRLLVETIVSWFAEQRCVGVDGQALPGDRGAKSFFESAGFKARLLTMHRPIG